VLVFIEQDGIRTGPYTLDEVRDRVGQGVLHRDSRAIPQGATGPVPLGDLLDRYAAAARPGAPAEPRYAGFWIRAAAMLIDTVVLWIPMAVVERLATPAGPDGFSLEASVIQAIAWWAYTASLHASPWGATLGKRAVGIRVTDLQGGRIGFGRATVRYLAGFLSAILLFIGFLQVAFSERKQALHDQIAGTLVVRG